MWWVVLILVFCIFFGLLVFNVIVLAFASVANFLRMTFTGSKKHHKQQPRDKTNVGNAEIAEYEIIE